MNGAGYISGGKPGQKKKLSILEFQVHKIFILSNELTGYELIRRCIMSDESNAGCGCRFASLSKLIFGILVVLLGAFLTFQFFPLLLQVVAACLGPFLVLVGLIIIAVAKE